MNPNNSVKVAFCSDGLNWERAANDRFVVKGEPSGLIKHDGLFYLNAHAGAARHPVGGASKRTVQTFVSADFENWAEVVHMSFKIIPSFEESDRAESRLVQGQAFENIGELTIFYYGIWTEVERDGPTGVRLAVWRRDRLGYFRVEPDHPPERCKSAPITPPQTATQVYLNGSGLAEESQLAVEILDEKFRLLPYYSVRHWTPIKEKTGLRVPIS